MNLKQTYHLHGPWHQRYTTVGVHQIGRIVVNISWGLSLISVAYRRKLHVPTYFDLKWSEYIFILMATCKIFKSQLPETNSIFVNYGDRCKLHFWVAYNFIYPVPEQIYLYYPARMADSIQLSSWILYPVHSYTIEVGSLIQFYRPNPVTLLKMQLGPSHTPVIVC